MSKDLFSEGDKQVLKDLSDTIESGLIRISDSLPSVPEPIDYAIQICEHGDHITTALEHIASALHHIAEAIEDKK